MRTNNNFTITYTTLKGETGSITLPQRRLMTTVQSMFKAKTEATIYRDDEVIGRIWRDDSQVSKMNYSIEL